MINFLNDDILFYKIKTSLQNENVTVIQREATKFETRERNFDSIIAN